MGVYCPPQSKTQELRTTIYAECEHILANTPATHCTTIIAGDFNATIQNLDRYREVDKCEVADNMHRQFLTRARLQAVDSPVPGTPRRYTYRRHTSSTPCSRIDDIYLNLTRPEIKEAQPTVLVTDMTGACTDHDMLTVTMPYHKLNMQPPLAALPPSDPTARRVKTPISKTDFLALSSAIRTGQHAEYMELAHRTARYMQEDVLPHWGDLERHNGDRPRQLDTLGGRPAREVVDELGSTLTSLLLSSLDLAMQTCSTVPVCPQGSAHYYPRGVARKKKKIIKQKQAVAYNLRKLSSNESMHKTGRQTQPAADQSQAPDSQVLNAVDGKMAGYKAQHPEATERGALLAVHKDLHEQLTCINKEHAKLSEQAEIDRVRKQLDASQKLGNRIATGKAAFTPRSALRILDTDQGTTTDPTRIMNIIETYYKEKLRVYGGGVKTGRYLPGDAPRDYPWRMDPLHRSYAHLLDGSAPEQREWLHDAIDDEVAFSTCLKSLAKGKAPGPDRVPNEILQALPDTGKEALHNLIRIMWATGLTPTSWKESSTILLFKHKGTALQLPYYRRIGLENTIYKLWTRMVTYAMADRAERLNMISSSQAGFRSKRTCAHQIEMMIMALEDAHLTKQDIYLLQADMTEAFDTISHDKLLMILYDLGFPTDAIEVVKDLYTGANTRIQTPHGPTQLIPFDRGTIQGDSLSPFLFVMYLEPLLRWLKAGRKGYMAGALKDQGPDVQAQHQISDITYADDVNIATGGPNGLANMNIKPPNLARMRTGVNYW